MIHSKSPEELVERLAIAESDLPWQRAVSLDGMEYLRACARGKLDRLNPHERERLIRYAEDVAARYKPKICDNTVDIPEEISKPLEISAKIPEKPIKIFSMFDDFPD